VVELEPAFEAAAILIKRIHRVWLREDEPTAVGGKNNGYLAERKPELSISAKSIRPLKSERQI
jgi:hypothetical protein